MILIIFFIYLLYKCYIYKSKKGKQITSVLITGATDGIGKSYVEYFSRIKGVKIYATGRSLEKLQELQEYNKDINIILCDYNNFSLINFYPIKEEIDTIINCAGISYDGAMKSENCDNELTTTLINVNCISPTKLINFFLSSKKIHTILLIGSANGIIPMGAPFYSIYAGTKAYIDQYTKSISSEYKNVNIQVHHPYLVSTKMSKIKKSSYFIPSPKEYVISSMKNLMEFNKYNVSKITYFPHKIQNFILNYLPIVLSEKIIYNNNSALEKKYRAIKSSTPI